MSQHLDPDDDDGGITGWEQGDADRQLVPGGGVTISDAGLARFGKMALIAGLVIGVIWMIAQSTGH